MLVLIVKFSRARLIQPENDLQFFVSRSPSIVMSLLRRLYYYLFIRQLSRRHHFGELAGFGKVV
jgi:hypothetical protein